MANFKLKESLDKKSVGTALAGVNIIPMAGFIMPFAGNTAPSGWALCNGSSGTPDLRGEFPIGATSSANIGTINAGSTHTHSYSYPALSIDNATGTHSAISFSANTPGQAITDVDHGHTISIGFTSATHTGGNFATNSTGSNTISRTPQAHSHNTNSSTVAAATNTSGGSHAHTVASTLNTVASEHTHTSNAGGSGTSGTGTVSLIPFLQMNFIMKL
jgi:microcystin-dependent protein